MQNHRVVGLTKEMDLLEIMMELDIEHYFILKNMIPFTIGLDTLEVKKVVLNTLFLITMQELKMIHMTLFL